MPAQITHRLIAQDASEYFPPSVKKAAKDYSDYFFLGAQGPDPYFFLKLCSKEKNLGKVLHANAWQTFCAFFGYCRQTSDARVTAYVAGYISHYATDVTFHPFVYDYLEKTRPRGMAHQLIENDWDVYFLRTLRAQEADCCPAPFSPREIIDEGVLYSIICDLTAKLNRRPVSKRALAKTVKRFSRFLKSFYRACYTKQARWQRVEKILHFKPLISCLYPQRNPNPLPDEDTALFFYRTAVNETVRLVSLFFERETLSKQDFSKNLHTGLQIDG